MSTPTANGTVKSIAPVGIDQAMWDATPPAIREAYLAQAAKQSVGDAATLTLARGGAAKVAKNGKVSADYQHKWYLTVSTGFYTKLAITVSEAPAGTIAPPPSKAQIAYAYGLLADKLGRMNDLVQNTTVDQLIAQTNTAMKTAKTAPAPAAPAAETASELFG